MIRSNLISKPLFALHLDLCKGKGWNTTILLRLFLGNMNDFAMGRCKIVCFCSHSTILNGWGIGWRLKREPPVGRRHGLYDPDWSLCTLGPRVCSKRDLAQGYKLRLLSRSTVAASYRRGFLSHDNSLKDTELLWAIYKSSFSVNGLCNASHALNLQIHKLIGWASASSDPWVIADCSPQNPNSWPTLLHIHT